MPNLSDTSEPPIDLDSVGSGPDGRTDEEHMREDPHFIAQYLAQNSSKAAAIFRRYDMLAMYQIIRLSRDLRSLERRHAKFMKDGVDLEVSNDTDFDRDVKLKIKEYCTTTSFISKTIEIC